MLKAVKVPLDEIYVPTARRKTLDSGKVETLAESILEDGLNKPIQVRQGKGRYVLVTGLHRLEALRSLGEETAEAYIVAARQF
jgi:ParB-like chromosome segregation protein Spo0J